MKFIKKIKNYLLAFIIPFIICLIVLYAKNVLQDIENIFVSDLRLQHVVFLNYLKNVLLGEVSIFYSFSAGMGNSMLSTIIFYCMSPVNLLLLLIKDIRYAIAFIYIVKVSLSGLTMFILLKNKMSQSNFITVLFSTCYALSSFVINYFFCGFWFDSLYLAPLVVLGIDKIFRDEKINFLYIFSLALAIICNIQMGFGLCVFSVIYYIYSFNINYNIKADWKKFKQLALVFGVSSLCAGAISSGALLGFGIDYASISTARDIEITTPAAVSNLGYIIKNFFTVGNLKTDYYNNYEPFIYCGLIVSFFSILYLFNTEIDKKKRVHAVGVILVFLVSFCVGFINLFWHLSSPVLLNYRYSIYLSLFLTILAYECYQRKQKLMKNDIIVLAILLLVGFFMVVVYANEVYIFWTFLFLVLIFILGLLAKNKSKKFEVLLSAVVIGELVVNGYLSIYTAEELPLGKYSSYDNLEEVAALNDFEDTYRVMYNYSYTDWTNDTLLLNKNSSLRYFSSVIGGNVVKFFERNVSAVGNNNYRISAYDSPLLISLLGNKYLYLTEELNNSIYKEVETYKILNYDYAEAAEVKKDVYLYENPYALSLGYVIEKDASYKEGMDLVDYQNEIIKSFSGIDEDVMIRLERTSSYDSDSCDGVGEDMCKTYHITNPTNNVLVYIYTLFDQYYLYGQAKGYLDTNRPVLVSTIDSKIDFTFKYGGGIDDETFLAATYDKSNLVDSLSILQQNMLENVNFDKNVMTGEINSDKSGILFLSIPYDERFEVYVDGVKTDYYSLLDDAFMGVDIEEGEHEILVRYVDNNYKWYIFCSIFSIIVTVGLYYFINKKIEKRQEEEKIKQEQLNEKRAKNVKKQKEKNRKRKK